jgi:hypothetical protein
MRVLHINHFDYPDYLNDMLLHGGKSVFGQESYFESSPAAFMYQGYEDKQRLYGKGFTLYCRLPTPPPAFSADELVRKIKDQYFDLVVYGSVFRNLQYWDVVERAYPKKRIVLIDGEDRQVLRGDIIGKGHYFKRELVQSTRADVHPINFGIPKDLIVRVQAKLKSYAHIDPADTSTYIFDNEEAYYRDYQESFFGWTQKKAGWDCLRHYEILMNCCFPAVRDVGLIPPHTMTGFPKQIIQDYYVKHGYEYSEEYWDALNLMVSCLEHNCTTEAMWYRILERLQ